VKIPTALKLLFLWTAGTAIAAANTVSYTGTLASPESTAEFMLTLTQRYLVTMQTYGFGGGTNAANMVISPGGTDPFLGVFRGTGPTAGIRHDGSGNPFGTSLDLTNYGNPNFLGCPPAGAPAIHGSPQCGDITMSMVLFPGTYTVLLSDGQYVPEAVFSHVTLGAGFSDLTVGNFCNILINGIDCPNSTGAYALDITTTPTTLPEPNMLAPLVLGMAGLAVWFRKRNSYRKI